jgi:signal transduction histidine kinase
VDPAALPPLLSREAYRIVQEGLSNALRHGAPGDGAGGGVALRVVRAGDRLEITVENPLSGPAPCRPGGGHGLRGIADRARLLGGTAQAGPAGGAWRLRVRLPMKDPA